MVASTYQAFAALLRSAGTVVAWGASDSLGAGVPSGLTGVVNIFTTETAFAALKADGTVVAFGSLTQGGAAPALDNVVYIYSNKYAFAALRSDRTVTAWGSGSGSLICPYNYPAPSQLHGSNPKFCYLSTAYATGALAGGCEVWCCLDTSCPSSCTPQKCNEVGVRAPSTLANVVSVHATMHAFAAVTSDATVQIVGFGETEYGGYTPGSQTNVAQVYGSSFFRSDSSQFPQAYACGAGQMGVKYGICEDCAVGKYASNTEIVSVETCTACDAGYTTANAASTTASDCALCTIGSYMNSAVLFSIGSTYGDFSIGESAFNAAFDWNNDIILRECTNCADSHKKIYYKRITDIGSTSMYGLMLQLWTAANNLLNVDFRLHSTLSDAQNDVNRWRFCNYDDNTGFPRDCGPYIGVAVQWFQLPNRLQTDQRVSVLRNDGICQTCTAGCSTSVAGATGSDASACTVCAPGYSGTSDAGTSGCTPCGVGKYGSAAAGNGNTCTDCGIGYSTSVAGATGSDPSACTVCAPGYSGTSDAGTSGCTPCGVGKYGSATAGNGNTCTACAAGYTGTVAGAASASIACTLCAAGYEGTSDSGTSGCTACPQGKYGSFTPGNSNACSDCGTGYSTSSAGTVRLPVLPALPYYRFRGSDYDATEKMWADSSGNTRNIASSAVIGSVLSVVQTAGSNGVTKTFTAVSGGEVDGVIIGNPQMDSYTFCAVARYAAPPKGSIFPAETNLNWLTGFHGGAIGRAYHVGWLHVGTPPVISDTQWHVLCDAGANFRWDGVQIGTTGGAVTYLPPLTINKCGFETPYDQTSNWQVAEMLIYDRTLTAAEILQVEAHLKYHYGIAAMTATVDAGECSMCAPGYYGVVSGGGTSGCDACPEGKFSFSAGAVVCTDCEAGYSTESTATAIKHPCRRCAPGYVGTSIIGVSGCYACDFGEYSEGGNYTSRCKKCPAGYTTPGMGTPGSDASACSICASGFEGTLDDDDILTCNACPSGKYSQAGRRCLGCGPGKYIVISGRANTEKVGICHYCEAGKYGLRPDATTCTTCEGGKYMERVGSSGACGRCPAGTKSAAGATVCTQCQPGTYSAVKSESCSECTAGFYSQKAAIVCKPCFPGSCSANGAASCTVCAAGRYSPAYSSECFICDAGYFSGMHAGKCEICPEGTYSAAEAAECQPCANGTFSFSGSSACEILVT